MATLNRASTSLSRARESLATAWKAIEAEFAAGMSKISAASHAALAQARIKVTQFAEQQTTLKFALGWGEIVAAKAGEHIVLGHRTGGLRHFAQEIGANHLLDVPENAWKGNF